MNQELIIRSLIAVGRILLAAVDSEIISNVEKERFKKYFDCIMQSIKEKRDPPLEEITTITEYLEEEYKI